jgi:predicted patatin/cPLA2 family phospholipase
MSLPPLDSTTTSTIQAPYTEAISLHDTQVGAASKSVLFRRQHSSAAKQHSEGDNHLNPSSKTATAAASTIQLEPNNTNISRTRGRKRKRSFSKIPNVTEITTVEELNQYWPRCLEEGEELDDDEDCLLPQDETTDPGRPLDYNQLLRGISVKGDTQIIGSKDHPDFVHPVVRLMHERQKEQATKPQVPAKKKENIALVVEGGGMRGCVSAGMVCAIHCLGLSDTIDVVYGSSAGAVIAAYFVSKQLPYYGPEVYYDSLTTLENPTASKTKPEQAAATSSQNNHVVDRYDNDYFIDLKRMTRSMGLGLCDPRLLKDVWTRRVHGKPMMNLHYMFQNIMLKKKPIDYETFVKRQTIQPLKIVATGLSSEKPVILSHEEGHFDTVEDLCNSLHASCLLPGIAGPVMNVLKRIQRGNKTKAEVTAAIRPKKQLGSIDTKEAQQQQQDQKPNFVLRNTHRERHQNDKDYEPLGDAMLSAPIPYDIAHDEGATHVLVIRSSPDGTNLLAAPSVMAWIGSMIFKRYFLKKNHLPGMYKRSQTEQRHQRVYAKTILELNNRANSPPPSDSREHQTMTIALEPGSDEVSHLETTREGIFKGVRQGFARAYDALVEDPDKRGRGKEMALLYFPDEILEYDPNDTRLSSSSPNSASEFRSAFEEYLSSTDVVPKTWLEDNRNANAIP